LTEALHRVTQVTVSETRPPPAERDEKERERRRLERLLPELVKRLVETGYEKISEGPENVRNFVNELRLPKEVLGLVLAQLEETKSGLYRVVAREIRDFLEHTSVSDELMKVLTGLSLEIKTQIRFVPSEQDQANPKPDVNSKVSIHRSAPPSPSSTPPPSAAPDSSEPSPSVAPEDNGVATEEKQ
jgi:hypothetical protein